MSVDISVSITEDVVDIIATPTVNIVNVTNSASIDPGLYDLSEFTNTSPNPFVRASGLSSYVPTSRTITINGLTQDLSINRSWTIPATTWGTITGTLSAQTDLQSALDAKVPTSRTLTINGVTQDLSADRTFTISTGITIGSTAIASGTVGRILFEGAGNVVQQSSSLTWDNAANRFQVGTGVNILATNTFPTNANSPYVVLGPYDANFGGDQGALFNLTNKNTSGNSAAIFRFGMTSPATGAIGEFGATSSTFSGFTSLVFFNSKGAFPLAFLTNDTERLRIHGSTGNVLIGTTTDAGFRLDVNGTARVQNDVLLNTGILATSAGLTRLQGSLNYFTHNRIGSSGTYGFQIAYVGSVYSFWRFNDGNLDVDFGGGGNLKLFANTERMRLFSSTGNVGINTTTDAGFRLDVNGTARVTGAMTIGNSVITGNFGNLTLSNNGIAGVVLTFTNNRWGTSDLAVFGTQGAHADASSQIEIRSTTRGFLPPRMTTTQKNAIATPAAGLVVYDTTLNKLCVYTTAWETVTSL